MTGGAGAPDFVDALSNLQDKTFDFIINPYDDTASLDAMKSFLNDASGRWAWDKQLYGHAFGATSGTYAELGTKGEARNNQHETLLGVYRSPTPRYIWSAALTGAIAPSLRNDPGRPLQSLPVYGVLAPDLQDRFELTERNNLLYSGISTYTVADDGTVNVENIITTYQKNSYGDEDDSYLQVETLFSLMFVTRLSRPTSSKLTRSPNTRLWCLTVTPRMLKRSRKILSWNKMRPIRTALTSCGRVRSSISCVFSRCLISSACRRSQQIQEHKSWLIPQTAWPVPPTSLWTVFQSWWKVPLNTSRPLLTARR